MCSPAATANPPTIYPYIFLSTWCSWQYAKGPLISGLYWTRWYNKEDKNDGIGKRGDLLTKFDNDTDGNILYENKLLGPPRLRQIRIKTNSCVVNEEFQNFITECYGEYDPEQIDTTDFAKRNTENDTNSP